MRIHVGHVFLVEDMAQKMTRKETRPCGPIIPLDHPLLQHKLTYMRRTVTECHSRVFSQLMREAGMILAVEVAGREFKTEEKEVTSETTGKKIKGNILGGAKPVIAPILRSGLTLAEGVKDIIPTTFFGHIGIHNPVSSDKPPVVYFISMPRLDVPVDRDGETVLEKRKVILVDPVIVSGETASAAIDLLTAPPYNVEQENIMFLTLIVGIEGASVIRKKYPKIRVYTAVDGEKVEDGDVTPGLGAVSNRLFRTA